MKQRLVVRPTGRGSWAVSGEGVNFYCDCSDRQSALYIAHQTRNQWYPRARVVVDELNPQEERFQQREWQDQMWSDWNE